MPNRLTLAAVRRRAARVLEILERDRMLKPKLPFFRPLRLEVALISSAVMKRTNARFRKKNEVTDVLSFPSLEALWEVGLLGEIALCGPQISKQANGLGHSDAFELDVLLVHGVLHLLGFDHEKSAAQARLMARHEGRLLRKLGRKQSATGLIRRTHSAR